MAKHEFNSTDHLNPEAVAAFVDGELSDAAFHRAVRHLDVCEECMAEVDCQRRAANRLRVVDDSAVHAPASLVERLAGLRLEDVAHGACGEEQKGTLREHLDTVSSALKSSLGALRRRGE
ncbi:anti-sigma factor family protein [Corynebacterium fournieri]|uniref:anti-sigma factor family protein n=1 Tax=Corynebacterium fournieri TaxID=1852390 RepID=UPI000A2F363F|nr:hypothetical protein [Corynebacterium fournieri]WJY97302.1 Anti-sigma-E factor RseA [Corynebacterium fournieri]